MNQSAGDHRSYPSIRFADLVRLIVRFAAGVARNGRSFDAGLVLREWYQQPVRRTGSENLFLSLGFKRFLVVTGRALSQHISAQAPREHGYAAGPTKVRAMSFLAPKALTIAHDERWRSLRAFNESVLGTVNSESDMQFTLTAVRKAFGGSVSDIADIRGCMRETMHMVVFGSGSTQARLLDDVDQLNRYVLNPGRRMLFGWRQAGRRRRFYSALRTRWAAGPAADGPSLVDRARVLASNGDYSEEDREDLVQQIPHWMFTFTGSGTDLLARTLGVLGSRDDAYARVRAEMVEHDLANDASAVMTMEYLQACLLEVCRLFPPVTRTFLAAGREDLFDGGHVPAGTEILHCFTEHHRDTAADATANDFRPERWLEPAGKADDAYPSLFLGGARTCPGRDLILMVCKAAICALMDHGRIRTRCAALSQDPMPRSFPACGLRYETDTSGIIPDGGSGFMLEERS